MFRVSDMTEVRQHGIKRGDGPSVCGFGRRTSPFTAMMMADGPPFVFVTTQSERGGAIGNDRLLELEQ